MSVDMMSCTDPSEATPEFLDVGIAVLTRTDNSRCKSLH